MTGWRVGLAVLVALSSLLAALPRAGTVTAADELILCVPEAIEPSEMQTGALVQQAADAALPYRVFLPGLTRADDPPLPDPSAELLALQERLAAGVQRSSVPGRFAVAVTDLQTGETIGVGLDRVQLSGCVMNLFAIIAALRDVDAGRYPLSDVDATIRQTIWASDATAARSLFRQVGQGDVVEGVRVVSRLLDSLHMSSSSIDHPPAFPEDSIGTGANNLVTARDMNRALGLVQSGEVLSPQLTAYLLGAMTHVKPGLNYLTAVVPAPAVVSHKNGFFWDPEGWVDNDTSIVRFGPELEYAYALTFLSEAVPTLYADIPLGQQLVRETWDYFQASYD